MRHFSTASSENVISLSVCRYNDVRREDIEPLSRSGIVMPLTRSESHGTLCPVPGNRLATIDGLGQAHTVPVDRLRDHQTRMTSLEEEERSSLSRVLP